VGREVVSGSDSGCRADAANRSTFYGFSISSEKEHTAEWASQRRITDRGFDVKAKHPQGCAFIPPPEVT